jgi:hypothetical protein
MLKLMWVFAVISERQSRVSVVECKLSAQQSVYELTLFLEKINSWLIILTFQVIFRLPRTFSRHLMSFLPHFLNSLLLSPLTLSPSLSPPLTTYSLPLSPLNLSPSHHLLSPPLSLLLLSSYSLSLSLPTL